MTTFRLSASDVGTTVERIEGTRGAIAITIARYIRVLNEGGIAYKGEGVRFSIDTVL